MAIDPQVLAFAGVAAALTITPGADTMLVIRSVLKRGRRAGFMTTFGICSGLFVHATLSAAGLSLILVRSAAAFEAVKLAGACYLVYLGGRSLWQTWRGRAGGDADAPDEERDGRPFCEGLLTNLLNPKVAIFYLAFLPQFIGPGDPVLAKSVLLAGIHGVEGITWLSLLTVFLGRLRPWLARPEVRRMLEALTGAILVAFGARLAAERR